MSIIRLPLEINLDDVWYACDYPERPYMYGDTLLCGRPCSACLVIAEVELNRLDPITAPRAAIEDWHYIISVLAGDDEPYDC